MKGLSHHQSQKVDKVTKGKERLSLVEAPLSGKGVSFMLSLKNSNNEMFNGKSSACRSSEIIADNEISSSSSRVRGGCGLSNDTVELRRTFSPGHPL